MITINFNIPNNRYNDKIFALDLAVYDKKYKICGKYPLTIITVFLVTSILERHNP